ncbi:MAG: serine/threonine-protein kinase, partial [Myxococcota bacterium]
EALEYAHASAADGDGHPLKVVHRDVSPSNVMVGFDGLVRLIDFGVAKSEAQTSSTRVGMVKGRVSYMSPEQVRRTPLDARSDIFAVGSVLLESLSGRRLFDRPTEFETVKAVLSHPIPRVPRYLDAEARRLWQVARRALFRRRWLRYPSARAMREAVLLGDKRDREEARDDLELWLGAVFARELERREVALRKALGSPTEFRILRDSGFELLPEVTDPLGRAQPSMLKVMDKTRSIKALRPARSWWAVGAVFGLASIGLGAFLARLDAGPSPRSGVLFVAADGPCEVMLGEQVLGSAPILGLEVPHGTHEVGCRNAKSGGMEVLIREGQSRFVRLKSERQGEEK